MKAKAAILTDCGLEKTNLLTFANGPKVFVFVLLQGCRLWLRMCVAVSISVCDVAACGVAMNLLDWTLYHADAVLRRSGVGYRECHRRWCDGRGLCL